MNTGRYEGFDNERKTSQFKKKFKNKIQDGRDWIRDNKDTISQYAPYIVGGVAIGTKVLGKYINLRKAESLGSLRCYDRSAGHYWQLRRKLSTDEWLYIERARKAGFSMGDILSELKVLK